MANQATTPTPVATKLTGKITDRIITPVVGKVLYHITQADGTVVRSTVTREQLSTLAILGEVPKVGNTVSYEFSVDSRTGVVSTVWVNMSL